MPGSRPPSHATAFPLGWAGPSFAHWRNLSPETVCEQQAPWDHSPMLGRRRTCGRRITHWPFSSLKYRLLELEATRAKRFGGACIGWCRASRRWDKSRTQTRQARPRAPPQNSAGNSGSEKAGEIESNKFLFFLNTNPLPPDSLGWLNRQSQIPFRRLLVFQHLKVQPKISWRHRVRRTDCVGGPGSSEVGGLQKRALRPREGQIS